jgi:hypothetical protein
LVGEEENVKLLAGCDPISETSDPSRLMMGSIAGNPDDSRGVRASEPSSVVDEEGDRTDALDRLLCEGGGAVLTGLRGCVGGCIRDRTEDVDATEGFRIRADAVVDSPEALAGEALFEVGMRWEEGVSGDFADVACLAGDCGDFALLFVTRAAEADSEVDSVSGLGSTEVDEDRGTFESATVLDFVTPLAVGVGFAAIPGALVVTVVLLAIDGAIDGARLLIEAVVDADAVRNRVSAVALVTSGVLRPLATDVTREVGMGGTGGLTTGVEAVLPWPFTLTRGPGAAVAAAVLLALALILATLLRTEPVVDALVVLSRLGPVSAVDGTGGTGGTGGLATRVVDVETAACGVLAVFVDRTDVMDGVGFDARAADVAVLVVDVPVVLTAGVDAVEGVVLADDVVGMVPLAFVPGTGLVTSGRSGPDIDLVAVVLAVAFVLIEAVGDEALGGRVRPAAAGPIGTVGPCLAAVGLLACGPVVGAAVCVGGRGREAGDRRLALDTVEAELLNLNLLSPDGSGGVVVPARKVDGCEATLAVVCRVAVLLTDAPSEAEGLGRGSGRAERGEARDEEGVEL